MEEWRIYFPVRDGKLAELAGKSFFIQAKIRQHLVGTWREGSDFADDFSLAGSRGGFKLAAEKDHLLLPVAASFEFLAAFVAAWHFVVLRKECEKGVARQD